MRDLEGLGAVQQTAQKISQQYWKVLVECLTCDPMESGLTPGPKPINLCILNKLEPSSGGIEGPSSHRCDSRWSLVNNGATHAASVRSFHGFKVNQAFQIAEIDKMARLGIEEIIHVVDLQRSC